MPAILRQPAKRSRHSQEDLFVSQCQWEGLCTPIRQHLFHHERKWRFDFAWIAYRGEPRKVAVEIDGGVYVQGGHSRGAAYEKNCEKFAEAAILGWTVLRVTSRHVKTGQAVQWLKRLMEARS